MSLDNFLHNPIDAKNLSDEERARFQRWVEKILSDPEKISTMIEDALKKGMFSEWEEESVNHKFRVGSYYPSIIERCLRQQAYSYLHPLPPTHEELAIFGEGRAIHELIALTLRKSGLISVEGSEVVVDLEFNEEAKLHGRIDDLLLIRLTDSSSSEAFRLFVPLEIKTIGALPDEPKQAHYYQLSTYLLAKNFPLGVLLYWAKREGKVRAFAIPKEEVMRSVLRERVFELHDAMKDGEMPEKEAAINRDYQQCERCNYSEMCNPFLIDGIPPGSNISLFDIESTLLDASERRRAALLELGLSSSMRPSDILDEETRGKYWELFNKPKYVELDAPIESGREKLNSESKLGRAIFGISSSRHERLLEPTRARLANLGVPLRHLILREPGNYDTDGRFKARWALRLAKNYKIASYFDRDAITSLEVKKVIGESEVTKEN